MQMLFQREREREGGREVKRGRLKRLREKGGENENARETEREGERARDGDRDRDRDTPAVHDP